MLYECVYVQRRFIIPEAEVDSLNVCVVESFGQFDVSRIKWKWVKVVLMTDFVADGWSKRYRRIMYLNCWNPVTRCNDVQATLCTRLHDCLSTLERETNQKRDGKSSGTLCYVLLYLDACFSSVSSAIQWFVHGWVYLIRVDDRKRISRSATSAMTIGTNSKTSLNDVIQYCGIVLFR